MSPTALKPGDRISEYLLEEKIGQGGFGEVWKARHHIWKDKTVAVKIPLNGEWVRRLKKEGVIQHGLGDAGVVKTLGMDPDHEPPYLILEYVDGGSLRGVIEKEGRFPVERALKVTAEALGILKAAHDKGVTHGDIKPENILLESTGKVLLADFGLSQVMKEAAETDENLAASLLTQQGEGIRGTIAYMSPEQKDPRRKIDHRTDIYSLGLVLFEMLTGSLPEGGEVPSDLNPTVSGEVDRIFRRCYSRLGKRFSTAEEALQAVERALEGLSRPKGSHPAGGPHPVPGPAGGLLTEKEAADFLRITLPDFRSRVSAGQIPATRSNGDQGFRLRDLAPIRRLVREEYDHSPGRPWPPPGVFAGFWVRLAAFMIDLCLFLSVAMFTGLGVALIPFLPVWLTVYGIIGHGFFGKTVGKWAMGIRVVRTPSLSGDGPQMHPGVATLRAMGKIFSYGFACIGFLMAAYHPQKRALHDLLSDTWVVFDRGRTTAGLLDSMSWRR